MPKLIYLTARDLDIMRAIGHARYLTSAAIEWLYFAGDWRTSHQAAIAANRPLPRPGSNVYARLRGLVDRGYIASIRRVKAPGGGVFAPTTSAYALTRAGLAELTAADILADIESATYTAAGRSDRSYRMLEHGLGIGEIYAAIRAQTAHHGLQLQGWKIDAQLAHAYDTVKLRSTYDDVSIIPDATFVLAGQRYMLEVERNTNNRQDITRKIDAYITYRQSAKCRDRYGTKDIVTLVVTTTRHQCQRMANLVADRLAKLRPGHAQSEYAHWRFFAANDERRLPRLHPLTIHQEWSKIASYTAPQATLELAELWALPSPK